MRSRRLCSRHCCIADEQRRPHGHRVRVLPCRAFAGVYFRRADRSRAHPTASEPMPMRTAAALAAAPVPRDAPADPERSVAPRACRSRPASGTRTAVCFTGFANAAPRAMSVRVSTAAGTASRPAGGSDSIGGPRGDGTGSGSATQLPPALFGLGADLDSIWPPISSVALFAPPPGSALPWHTGYRQFGCPRSTAPPGSRAAACTALVDRSILPSPSATSARDRENTVRARAASAGRRGVGNVPGTRYAAGACGTRTATAPRSLSAA